MFPEKDSQKDSNSLRGPICLTRGGNSLEMQFETNPFQHVVIDPLFENQLIDRESIPRRYEDHYEKKGSIMSEENPLFRYQRISEQSLLTFERANSRGSRGTNWLLKLPFQKNSDVHLQSDQFEPKQKYSNPFSLAFNQYQDLSLFPSNRPSSIQNFNPPMSQIDKQVQIRLSGEGRVSNKSQSSLELVMEWADDPMDPQELKDMLSKLTLENIQEQMQMQQQLKPDRLSLLPQKQMQGCICKKTKCLKLYCQCFQGNKVCSDLCECIGCCNNDEHKEERENIITMIQKKNPNAFKQHQDTCENDHDSSQIGHENMNNKGCNCKKSKCQKKYCECYSSGIGCGEHCNCENCLNVHHEKQQLLHQESDKDQLDQFMQQEVPSILSKKKPRLH